LSLLPPCHRPRARSALGRPRARLRHRPVEPAHLEVGAAAPVPPGQHLCGQRPHAGWLAPSRLSPRLRHGPHGAGNRHAAGTRGVALLGHARANACAARRRRRQRHSGPCLRRVCAHAAERRMSGMAQHYPLPPFGATALLRRRPRLAIRRETLVAIVLYGMAWLCLFRATGMWFGYPSTQQENASVEPATQQAMLYSLIPLIGIYCALEPMRVASAVLRIPISVVVLGGLIVVSVLFSQQ